MNFLKTFALGLVVFLTITPQFAAAAVGTCIGTISIITEQPGTSSAHIISFNNTSCTDACGAYRRAYIDFNDKPLFATALSAAMSGTTVGVQYDTSASVSKGSGTSEHNSIISCKVLNIFK